MSEKDEDDSAPLEDQEGMREQGYGESGDSNAPTKSTDTAGFSRSSAGLLGSRTAFQLDPEALAGIRKAIQVSAPIPDEYYQRLQTSIQAVAAAAAASGRVQLPTAALEGLRDAVANIALPADALTGMQGALRSAFPEGYWERFAWTARTLQQSVSVPSLYSQDQLASLSAERTAPLRNERSAEAFFDEHSVEVADVRSMLRALTTIQSKHHDHQLVWRGQQDVQWPTHSSLFRKLEAQGLVSEARLVTAERTALEHARTWGENPTAALRFFADLQHYGAPTRLLDATLDPEMAAWFAVEANPERDAMDGRVIAWGRVVRTSARKFSDLDEEFPSDGKSPFWHEWQSDADRARVGWGTGSRTWSWFPPALSDRMRSQRAGFLLEAGPLVTPSVADVISAGVSQDWRVEEINRATSIIGLPSRHDIATQPNDAHLVPLFSIRISANAKPMIREYLRRKGLTFSTVYPDRGGLVAYLNGPFGLEVPSPAE